ncbi:hypothetical protein GS531_24705 [Rhodococcus hoagii]|nr:hypothetical protein [Prescottella equi]
MSREVPVRARILRLDRDVHVLVLVLHHIVADGFSIAPLSRMSRWPTRRGSPADHPAGSR